MSKNAHLITNGRFQTKISTNGWYKLSFIKKINKSLAKLSGKHVILYGLGSLTTQLCDYANDLNFTVCGLLDRDLVKGEFYGFPIYNINDADEICSDILITALGDNKRIIFDRIKDITTCNIWYPDGTNPRMIMEIPQIDYEMIHEWINKHDVISFDLFDTILVRKCVEPSIVYDMLGERHNEPTFASLRRTAGRIAKKMSRTSLTIENLYATMDTAVKAENELALEKELLYTRSDIIELFEYTKCLGKTIIITSDMWYSENVLDSLLKNLNISGYSKIYVSSDYNKSKADGSIWVQILQDYPQKEIFHIGDDDIADDMNVAHSVKTVVIPKMADMLGFRPACEVAETTSDWLTIGKCIKSINAKTALFANDIGSFIAPLVFSFVKWLKASTKEEDKILFCARDAYLFFKVWEYLYGNERIKYLYLSKRVLGGMLGDNLEMLKRYLTYYYVRASSSISAEEAIFRLTGVTVELGQKNVKDVRLDDIIKYVECNYKRFKQNAINERANFNKYLQINGIDRNFAIVDFICGQSIGLLQHVFCGNQYFYAIYDNIYLQYNASKTYSFSRTISNLYFSESDVVKNMRFAESLMSAPEGSCICFSNNGTPILDDEHIDFSSTNDLYASIIAFGDTNCSNAVAEKLFAALFCGRYDIMNEFTWSSYTAGKN